MEEKKKKGYSLFFRALFVFFIMFLCLYSISMNGYVENINRDKTLYTEEQIAQFEKDVLSGKEVDVGDYITEETIDYSNGVSNFGEDVSEAIGYTANKAIQVIVSFFGVLFK